MEGHRCNCHRIVTLFVTTFRRSQNVCLISFKCSIDLLLHTYQHSCSFFDPLLLRYRKMPEKHTFLLVQLKLKCQIPKEKDGVIFASLQFL